MKKAKIYQTINGVKTQISVETESTSILCSNGKTVEANLTNKYDLTISNNVSDVDNSNTIFLITEG